MDPAIASIIVAVIGAVVTIFGFAIKEFRSMGRRNTQDHDAVMEAVIKVQDTVDKVGDRLDTHIDWHLKK